MALLDYFTSSIYVLGGACAVWAVTVLVRALMHLHAVSSRQTHYSFEKRFKWHLVVEGLIAGLLTHLLVVLHFGWLRWEYLILPGTLAILYLAGYPPAVWRSRSRRHWRRVLRHSKNADRRFTAVKALAEDNSRRSVDAFIEALNDDYCPVRREAAALLGGFEVERAWQPLVIHLQDFEADVRLAAAEALGKIGVTEASEALRALLTAKEGEVRRTAAASLALLGETQWQKIVFGKDGDWQALLDSGDDRVLQPMIAADYADDEHWRSAAGRALLRADDVSGFELLVKNLDSKQELVVTAAIEALGESGMAEAVLPLANRLRSSAIRYDYSPTRELIEALGRLGDPRGAKALETVLTNTTPSTRRAAAQALAQVGRPKWHAWVHGDSGDWRRLAESGDPEAIKVVRSVASSRSTELAKKAEQALLNAGDPDMLSSVKSRLCDRNVERRREAASMLDSSGRMRWTQWVRGDADDFDRLAESGDSEAHRLLVHATEAAVPEAVEVLGRTKCRDAAAPLATILKGKKSLELRAAAVRSLGELQAAEAIPHLIEALSDHESWKRCWKLDRRGSGKAVGHDEWDVRWAAVNALASYEPDAVVPALLKALGNVDSELRANAAKALDKLGRSKWRRIVKGQDDDWTRLVKARGEEALIPVAEILHTWHDPDARKAAAERWAQEESPQAVDHLIRALLSPPIKVKHEHRRIPSWTTEHNEFRVVAARALGRHKAASAVEPLIRMLADKEPNDVRSASIQALGDLGDARAIEPLTALVGNRGGLLVSPAITALGKLGAAGQVVEDALVEALTQSNAGTRRDAAELLATLGAPKWRNFVGSDDWDEDLKNLGTCADMRVASALCTFATRPAAIEALGMLGGSEAVAALTRNLVGHALHIRRLSAETLARLAQTQPTIVANSWQEIRSRACEPHSDATSRSHTDNGAVGSCHGDWGETYHTDHGIGVAFPEAPLDF